MISRVMDLRKIIGVTRVIMMGQVEALILEVRVEVEAAAEVEAVVAVATLKNEVSSYPLLHPLSLLKSENLS